jgi:hypothetical protein
MALTLLIAIALITACTTPSSDPGPLQLQEVAYGGCAGIFNMLVPEAAAAAVFPSVLNEGPDTLIVDWDDTLKVFLGLNHICCAPFTAEYQIIQDTLMLAVRDTCPPPYTTCYCWCYCYYTFTWKFLGAGDDLNHLRVELYDPRVDTVVVLYREELE